MKRLYRLQMTAWYPVILDEDQARTMAPRELHALYEDLQVNPYDLDDLTLQLERASAADIAKYGDDEDE